jgi:hypothetical protein
MESLFETALIGIPTINHNDTQNIQGGTTSNHYHYRIVDTFASLTAGTTVSEMAKVQDEPLVEYTWDGSAWEKISSITDEPTGFTDNG